MLIECQPSNICSDIRCAICGQGFLMFAEGQIERQRDEIRSLVQHVLRQHHQDDEHPKDTFTVEWNHPHPSTVAV